MSAFWLVFRSLLPTILIVLPVSAQQPLAPMTAAESASGPEMQRLARALVGTWNATETFERNESHPNGAGRKGTAEISVGTGGTTLIEDYHTDGSAGKLDFLAVIWWDQETKLYGFFTCGNGHTTACRTRGTARWDRDSFVNEYDLEIKGSKTKWRDSFSQITPTSFTLIAAMKSADGTMKPMITTKYTRK
jgi:hypothetical protein